MAVLKCLLEIGEADTRSAQKIPAGVLVVRRGLFFVKRQRRCPYISKSIFSKDVWGGGVLYYYYSFCQAFFRFPIKIMISYMNLSYIRLEPVFNSKFNTINCTMGKNNLQGKLILLYATSFKSSLMYCECIFCTAY